MSAMHGGLEARYCIGAYMGDSDVAESADVAPQFISICHVPLNHQPRERETV